MQKNIEYQIMAHENGWAVVVCDVIGGTYPSRHLALAAAKQLESEVVSTEEAEHLGAIAHLTLTDAVASDRLRISCQMTVAVSYQVDIPCDAEAEKSAFHR
ncbi:hypothetical protein EN41_04125 [Agrobacterium tumefaciens]|uniref:Uncharacterized protein n=1 Tax=Agrobacterium fabrum (strain C58 / ATCC 33970) TaxID=176299 RepID=A9CL46_AGRFC|nr:hypothetical protein [Agrobacterium fabrum]KEY51873.1 hypothetical protein EN41_04125 [Agrobacterium tumefaciens]AAK90862.1 hypothetical protein Atu5485 [Agrobacterium fabrum str. C58]KJX89901.1 hypothetical protein SY94_5530 [Agrobacterium tumefaciens]MCX2875173.1 hypothetical protein [Agrobacterium fabrum]NMV70921.1 hypothetical protein [Agrobacterium fabrum]